MKLSTNFKAVCRELAQWLNLMYNYMEDGHEIDFQKLVWHNRVAVLIWIFHVTCSTTKYEDLSAQSDNCTIKENLCYSVEKSTRISITENVQLQHTELTVCTTSAISL